jgi:hypothetical protein
MNLSIGSRARSSLAHDWGKDERLITIPYGAVWPRSRAKPGDAQSIELVSQCYHIAIQRCPYDLIVTQWTAKTTEVIELQVE